jgi:hypothetical protein
MNGALQQGFLLGLLTGILACSGCTHEPDVDPTDARLLELARGSEASTWYAGSSTPLPRSSGSGHQEPFLRTRYNSLAASVLDSGLMVSLDTLFPEGSLIVKELMTDASTVDTYAILLKESGDPAADASGWVWGYIRTDGTVRVPAADQGAACRSCHTQAGHIDQTLMNISFP